MVPSLKKKVVMKNLFLTINENSALELSVLDNIPFEKIVFDINSDYDGSVKSFATFLNNNNITKFISSSSLDFPDEYGIDDDMLIGFFDSVKTYEVNQMNKVISRSVDKYELEGDVREAYVAWMNDMKGVSIESNTEYNIENGLDLEVAEMELIDFV